MKKIVLLSALVLQHSFSGIAINSWTQDAINQLKVAVHELAGHAWDITPIAKTSTYYNGRDLHTVTKYSYKFRTPAARTAFSHYQDRIMGLSNAAHASSIGDGFILGILTGVCNKLIGNESLNHHGLLATIIAPVAFIIFQNHQAEEAPYFDAYLEQRANYFETLSSQTISRAGTAIAAALFSYFGANYMIDRIADISTD